MALDHFKKLSIRWKVALATSVYILFVLLGAIFFTAFSFEQKLLKEKNQNTVENIKNIIESYKDSFVLRNLEKIDEMVKKIDELPSVFYVSVFDTEGRIIGDTDISNLGFVNKKLLKLFSDQPYLKRDKNIVAFYYPVRIDRNKIGFVISKYDLNLLKYKIDREILKILIQTFAIATLVILISFAGVFVISGYMVQPLINLKNKITKITTTYIDSSQIDLQPVDNLNADKKCIKSVTSECWLVSENPGDILLSLGDTSLKECSGCEKFKNLSGDEINQLNYSFYMMVASLKEYLRKLDEAHRERETLNCMATMGEMSAKIAHEVKNALYAIGNAANYMRNNIENDLVKEFSGVIKDEVNRLNKMTVTFLNFSKLIEPKFEIGDFNAEIEKSILLLKPDMEDEGIELIYQPDKNLPQFYFDKNLMKQVIFNLVLNSIDALKEKRSKNKYIKVRTEYIKMKEKEIARLVIEDNGSGIPKENRDKIFQPFFTTKPKGTGLGLPMVYKIVFSHNGGISIESEEGKGTKFVVDLRIR
ncbi:ATP-binding protein [Persephonella sp.]|uniref:ATP-binding protein n=1 Tax=Persephonella sp. TaxID=2060922 RepID=UPI0025D8CE3F|nr:ATP-binding protein [Persephonella sp.]